MEEGPQSLPPPSVDPISRPIPQQHPPAQPQQPSYHGPSPAATTGGHGNGLPTCQNCSTSTTPLWRRDEFGSVLCNACGLFLKLHGRPRPISLKTDVIKSRNRVKTMRTDLAPKKKMNAQNNQAARRKSANGMIDGHDSPISRTGTPSLYNQSLPFMVDDPYATTGVSGFAPGDGTGSPLNGDRGLDAPQTHEQLIAQNSSLKTRVSELEFINELFRGRLSQLEQQEAAAARRDQEATGLDPAQSRSSLEISQENEQQLRVQLDDSHRRENSLKRRLDEMELELKALKDAAELPTERPAKKARIQSPLEAQTEAQPEPQSERNVEPQPEPQAEPQLEIQLSEQPEEQPEKQLEREAAQAEPESKETSDVKAEAESEES
ncbi:unnamed protein product [Clonostachys rosea]|uniref:GATA-type domain-containing protein n=1 Tax=Bionectria ochroleuca TaxID=29856 RepID=A0ABY6U616_BIOOC|nr:unnamed protein product [Clonostachys rosea]